MNNFNLNKLFFAVITFFAVDAKSIQDSDLQISSRVDQYGLVNYLSVPGVVPGSTCEPTAHMIEFERPADHPADFWMPPCGIVHYCEECCKNPLLTAVPVPGGMKEVNFTAHVVTYPGAGRVHHHYNKVKTFTFKTHTKCQCGCKIYKNDCRSPLHEFNEKACVCACTNKDEHRRCLTERERFLRSPDPLPLRAPVWNPWTCACECHAENNDCSPIPSLLVNEDEVAIPPVV